MVSVATSNLLCLKYRGSVAPAFLQQNLRSDLQHSLFPLNKRSKQKRPRSLQLFTLKEFGETFWKVSPRKSSFKNAVMDYFMFFSMFAISV